MADLTNRSLADLEFDNRFTNELPADPEADPQATGAAVRPRQVHGAAYSWTHPTPVAAPRLIAHSPEVVEMLGLSPDVVETQQFAEVFGGNELLPGMQPFAMCYGGHQFGNWAGQLGDGRAIALGEIETPHHGHQTLQLKGAGPTPYSRRADGRAVLRSSIREFLCSEAMHHLGVPTTRALSLVLTGDQVVRDMLYDGHPAPEPGAIVCRVASSFVRFGNFEIFSARGDESNLRLLADHAMRVTTPSLEVGDYLGWFQAVVDRTADLMVHWMRVGFVHGVMNTDNLAISGETIDYGPYGWIDNFDPGWTPNTTDAAGKRYRYGHQPQMAMWNLAQLANAIYPLVGDAEPLQAALDSYRDRYLSGWDQAVAAKIGLAPPAGQPVPEAVAALTGSLLDLLTKVETDMTIFFRTLGEIERAHLATSDDRQLVAPLEHAYYSPTERSVEMIAETSAWLRSYGERIDALGVSDADRRSAMHAVNPKYVLRNYLAQQAIDKAEMGEYSMILELLDVMRSPYADQPGREEYASKRPDWAREKVGCSMLSCSS